MKRVTENPLIGATSLVAPVSGLPTITSLLFLLLLQPSFAFSNDTAAGLDGGELVFKKMPGVEMQEEELTLSPQRVQVKYVFFNTTKKDIKTLVAFPIEFQEESDLNFDSKVSNPNGFSVKVNGESRAFKTERSLKSGVYRIRHHWEQLFPAQRKIVIEHEYRPIFESGVEKLMAASPKAPQDFLNQYYEKFGEEFCMSSSERKKLQTQRVTFDVLRYILTTANSWDGPIGRFTLQLHKGQYPYVFFCTNLKLKKVSPGLFEATAKDFRPTKDLKIAFGSKP